MDINSIILELLSRIKVLEEKVAILESNFVKTDLMSKKETERTAFNPSEISEKYRALAEYLYERWEKRITLTYQEIESILGFSLPPTAYKIPQSYWANTKSHSYASCWLTIGYKAKLSAKPQTVVFERNLY